ncbi:NADP-dependent oxidoreductase [Aminobacter sp. LjRoot7]|uniref:NADP-dependent oxidoreductase n=1 Tax=Aminobacter sp. LjRoot7 TaxID=3342335 RepID=UPI003ECD2122
MSNEINRAWRLRHRPEGEPRKGDLELVEEPIRLPSPDEVLIRTIYLSLDPTNRIWMSDMEQYLPPVQIGDMMRGVTLAVVEQSRSDRFATGDVVMPHDGAWAAFQTLPAARLSKVPAKPDLPRSAYMSALGPPGLTGFVGIVDIGGAKEAETVTISAAAGAVGSIAGQIAKARGCRVIGIAGGPDKCSWLVDELGFDAAIDYKASDVGAELRRLCPDGIDMHFENVGGAILDAAIASMKIGGRIALCGMISAYNEGGPVSGPREFQRVLMQRLTIHGFLVMDHFRRARDGYAEIEGLIRDNRLKWKDHIVDGLDNAPDALNLLFSGKNDGKLMVRVSEP